MNRLKFLYTPEISIILATYNRAEYLTTAINSIIEQTFQDWELIIVDDGSQDHTFVIVDSYLQKFSNIRYIKHQNHKQGFSRNIGIQVSLGNYITFLDSDDSYKPNHLESRLEYMKAHPELDLIVGGCEVEEEIWIADYFNPGNKVNLRSCIQGATFFGKRDVFFGLQGFNNIDYGEDIDMWERAEKMVKTEKITSPETYIYTRATNSITKDFFKNLSI